VIPGVFAAELTAFAFELIACSVELQGNVAEHALHGSVFGEEDVYADTLVLVHAFLQRPVGMLLVSTSVFVAWGE
jgi:hypothetical protein